MATFTDPLVALAIAAASERDEQDRLDGLALRRLREALPDDGFRYSIRVSYDHSAVSVGRWDVRFDGEHPRLHTREGAYGIGHGETLAEAANECRERRAVA